MVPTQLSRQSLFSRCALSHPARLILIHHLWIINGVVGGSTHLPEPAFLSRVLKACVDGHSLYVPCAFQSRCDSMDNKNSVSRPCYLSVAVAEMNAGSSTRAGIDFFRSDLRTELFIFSLHYLRIRPSSVLINS